MAEKLQPRVGAAPTELKTAHTSHALCFQMEPQPHHGRGQQARPEEPHPERGEQGHPGLDWQPWRKTLV